MSSTLPERDHATRPNILIFCVDQHRADHLGCAGNPVVKTPALDALARAGTRFANAYCASPACMPARATMFTGLSNRAHGVRGNGYPLNASIPTLPGLLAGAGYDTYAVGKMHLQNYHSGGDEQMALSPSLESMKRWERGELTASTAPYYGFRKLDLVIGHGDYISGDYKTWLDKTAPGEHAKYRTLWDPGDLDVDPELHYNHWIADRTIAYLEQQRDAQNPFLIWCSFPDPHFPFSAVKQWADRYRDADIRLPPSALEVNLDKEPHTLRAIRKLETMNPALLREYTVQTYAMISHVDEQIGRVLSTLAERGLDENTVVVFISDHGEQLGEHGGIDKAVYPYNAQAQIPFIVRLPGSTHKGQVVGEIVSQLDLVPTLLDLARVEQPDDPNCAVATRAELAPLLPSLPGESLRPVLECGDAPQRNCALVEYDLERQVAFEQVQIRMLVMPDHKLTLYLPTGELLLFDRRNDPWERKNLAHDPACQGVLAAMLRQMIQEISRTEPRLPRNTGYC